MLADGVSLSSRFRAHSTVKKVEVFCNEEKSRMTCSIGRCAMWVRSCTALFYIISPMVLGSTAWAAWGRCFRMAQGHLPHRSQSILWPSVHLQHSRELTDFGMDLRYCGIMIAHHDRHQARLGIVGLNLGTRLGLLYSEGGRPSSFRYREIAKPTTVGANSSH